MKFTLPKIYPLTDRRISGISHAEQAEKLIDGGARLIQLREKYAAPDEFYEMAKQAVELANRSGVGIIINDRVDIALALKAGGIHLGQEDLPPAEARKLLGPNAIIGYSTHNIEQVDAAKNEPVDYIAFGPIYPTASKEDPDPVVGLEKLREIKTLIGDLPLVAIGGINAENYREVLAAGADSVAMISAVISKPGHITSRIKSFLS
jgi:thiamine-phosphate pyrophosphorylase